MGGSGDESPAQAGRGTADAGSAGRILFVRNPAAGSADAWERVADRLEGEARIEVVETESPDEATELAHASRTPDTTAVVAAGGDGTVHALVQGLATRGDAPALGIVPLGTGNDLSRVLSIPEDPVEAVEAALAGGTRRIDVIELERDDVREYVVNACSGGFGGEVTSRIDEEMKETWGRLAYLRVAFAEMTSPPVYDLFLSIDGEPEERWEAHEVVLANGSYVGGGIPLVPDGSPDDGRLDLVLVRPGPRRKILGLLPALLRGDEPDSDLFFTARCETVELRSRPEMTVSVDGEAGRASSLRARIRPSALDVLVPPS
ncbi:MAG: diacylglycerol kinase family lipid kinase [Gemmatimonadota bacterium]|nr:diacylglycerol kinase family lipid kinase [Gemmatimonadota bacterium]